jgi:Uma2 family endonuclease
VTVVCGQLIRDSENASTITNPVVLVEVLSPSTAEYDRGEKLSHYQRIDSVQHMVHVAHDARRVEVWSRTESGFTRAAFEEGSVVLLPAVGCELEIAGLFRDPLAGSGERS